MNKNKIEWLLRAAVFGAALAVGIAGAWSVWSAFHDYLALLLFVVVFAFIFILLIYVVRRRNLGMLETR
jgi:energy-converting hydrogenase Eha subunit E